MHAQRGDHEARVGCMYRKIMSGCAEGTLTVSCERNPWLLSLSWVLCSLWTRCWVGTSVRRSTAGQKGEGGQPTETHQCASGSASADVCVFVLTKDTWKLDFYLNHHSDYLGRHLKCSTITSTDATCSLKGLQQLGIRHVDAVWCMVL